MPTAVAPTSTSYADYVNPQWVRLLDLLQMNVVYTRCVGAELHTFDGDRILDFLSGYCVHNTGHNHPHIIRALEAELVNEGPAMVQSHVPDLAGELAALSEKLVAAAGKSSVGAPVFDDRRAIAVLPFQNAVELIAHTSPCSPPQLSSPEKLIVVLSGPVPRNVTLL